MPSPAAKFRKARPSRGKRGEELAAEYLETKGFQIIARNWRSSLTRHEIDLIARDGNCIVFVEVKTARTTDFGDPITWITPRKQAAIIKAAQAYLAGWQSPDVDFRFDAIAISPASTAKTPTIEHVRGAFTCDLELK